MYVHRRLVWAKKNKEGVLHFAHDFVSTLVTVQVVGLTLSSSPSITAKSTIIHLVVNFGIWFRGYFTFSYVLVHIVSIFVSLCHFLLSSLFPLSLCFSISIKLLRFSLQQTLSESHLTISLFRFESHPPLFSYPFAHFYRLCQVWRSEMQIGHWERNGKTSSPINTLNWTYELWNIIGQRTQNQTTFSR